MFWKNVNLRFLHKKSITTRLTLFYALASFLLLTVIVLLSYFVMINIQFNNDKQFLLDKINVIQYMLEKNLNNDPVLIHEVQDVPVTLTNSIYQYSIRIIDRNKQIFIETPGMQANFGSAEFFKKNNFTGKMENEWWFSPAGKKYLLMQSIIQLKNKNSHLCTIQAALNVSYQHEIIKLYRNLAIYILIVGEIIAIFIGNFIARKGLKRLHELTHRTQNITASSLNQRIVAKHWPLELRKLGSAFNDMLDRIEDAFTHLKQFSDDLAHELRTPINNLLVETEVVLSRHHSEEEYRKVLESNLEELQRVAHIIENLLFLARAENPHQDLKKTSLNVEDEIAVISEYHEPLAEEKNLRIDCTGRGKIVANSVMFRRAINNILSNAIKYSVSGGVIHLHIKQVESWLEINVKDNGIGIAHEHLSKIFARFYRVDAARSSVPGIGLGLAIVKSIMLLHQGTVSVVSQLGQGTVVTMRFPQ